MPNNAEARRVKDKKKKDKEKKTVPFPLHKEDKASVDTPSFPLAAKDKASEGSSSSSLSLSGQEQASLDTFFLSYAGTYIEALLVPGHEQNAFTLGYSRALPEWEKHKIHIAMLDAHPNVKGTKEQAAL